MSLFDTIKYPLSCPPLIEELENLSPELMLKFSMIISTRITGSSHLTFGPYGTAYLHNILLYRWHEIHTVVKEMKEHIENL